MNFTGAEIPAWGMFALAVVYLAFQFVIKWQQSQAEKVAKREGAKGPEELLAEHDATLKEMTNQLAAITGALGGIATVLSTLAQQMAELHQIHLGPKALDDDNRPKWWSDRDLMSKIRDAVNEMNHRLARMESDIRRQSSKDSVTNLHRPMIEKK